MALGTGRATDKVLGRGRPALGVPPPPCGSFHAARKGLWGFRDTDVTSIRTTLAKQGLTIDAVSLAVDSRSVLTVGGKAVLRGILAMIDQTSHARGILYLYNAGDVQFLVVTDDPAWAAVDVVANERLTCYLQ